MARTLAVAALLSVPFAPVQGQGRSATRGGPDRPDTVRSTRVILWPASETYDMSRIERATGGRPVVAVYTTDGEVAARIAARLQASAGGALVSFALAVSGPEDLARVLVDSVVERSARQNLDRAIILVAEPKLFRPILVRVFGERDGAAMVEGALVHFVISVRADNQRTITRPAPRRRRRSPT